MKKFLRIGSAVFLAWTLIGCDDGSNSDSDKECNRSSGASPKTQMPQHIHQGKNRSSKPQNPPAPEKIPAKSASDPSDAGGKCGQGECKRGKRKNRNGKRTNPCNGNNDEEKPPLPQENTPDGYFPRGRSEREQRRSDLDGVPTAQMDTHIENPPTQSDSEIWQKATSKIEKLVYAKQVRFAPLGAPWTSLQKVSEKIYLLKGKCVFVDEKHHESAALYFVGNVFVNGTIVRLITVKFIP